MCHNILIVIVCRRTRANGVDLGWMRLISPELVRMEGFSWSVSLLSGGQNLTQESISCRWSKSLGIMSKSE
jgi:hypothetical protein